MNTGTTRQHGIALIVALLMLSILSAIGLGLSLLLSVDPMAGANQREAASALYVARAGLELAAHELASMPSWDPWLSGATTSALTDGPATGPRRSPSGDEIDIARLTNQLTCRQDDGCSDADVAASSRDRPWGPNNPRWRPFIYGSAADLGLGAVSDRHYVIAWIGDDSAERDGRPDVDGPDTSGGGRARVIVRAFGPIRSVQTIEAEVWRRCEAVAAERVCEPGLRVAGVRMRGG